MHCRNWGSFGRSIWLLESQIFKFKEESEFEGGVEERRRMAHNLNSVRLKVRMSELGVGD